MLCLQHDVDLAVFLEAESGPTFSYPLTTEELEEINSIDLLIRPPTFYGYIKVPRDRKSKKVKQTKQKKQASGDKMPKRARQMKKSQLT